MFNLYEIYNDRPRNLDLLEEECIAPELDTPFPENTTTPDNPEAEVLNEIKKICKLRCVYNHELITFFSSTVISDDEKIERLSSLYPEIKDKKKISKSIPVFIKFCKDDLSFFYSALKKILKYRNNEYPKSYPIFFELSEFFNLYLVERKSEASKKQRKTSASQNYSNSSEEPIVRYCRNKLKPHLESKFNALFDSLFELKCQGAVTGYIYTNHQSKTALPQLLSYHTTQKEKKFAYFENHFATTAPNDIIQLYLENKCFKAMSKIMDNILQLKTINLEILKEMLHPTSKTSIAATTIVREHCYKIYHLNEKLEKQYCELEVLISLSKKELAKNNNISHPVSEIEEETKTEAESTQSPVPLCSNTQENEEFEFTYTDAATIEHELANAYAEFQALSQKKAQQKCYRPNVDEETKETAEEINRRTIMSRLQVYNLQKTHIDTLEQIFSTPVPHYQITWDELEKLIQKCYGSIDNETGSSRRIIRLHAFNGLIDQPINQRGIHQGHQSGHNEATVSRWSINIVRTAFERAGITQEIVHFLGLPATLDLVMHTPGVRPPLTFSKQN